MGRLTRESAAKWAVLGAMPVAPPFLCTKHKQSVRVLSSRKSRIAANEAISVVVEAP